MLSKICDRTSLLSDGITQDVNHHGEDLLGNCLAHEVRKLVVDHKKQQAAYAHHLYEIIAVARLKLVQDEVYHDLD